MFKIRFLAVLLIVAGIFIGYFDYTKNIASVDEEPQLFKLGLDLSGGIYLEYLVDVSSIPQVEVKDAMEALRDLIERRVNVFGVAEPIVQTKQPGLFGLGDGTKEQRLIVELPGVDDVKKAQEAIGMIPVLEFREHRPAGELEAILAAKEELRQAVEEQREDFEPDPLAFEDIYIIGDLTGRFLDRASLQFDTSGAIPGGEPIVLLNFNKEGAKMFAELTKENAGGTIPIYVDGEMISNPRVGMEYAKTGITGGTAQISGGFTAQSAKDLAWRLNSGALPVDKLELLESRAIGATLGEQALAAGIKAGIIGLALIAVFLILWYRLPGLVAVVALGIYIIIMLALFKIIPVALTAAGIAGIILSIGMAVDANILIFERMKEELRAGRTLEDAIREGFSRAWPSIRDGNLSSLITAVILFWFGTSLVEGFALTFGLGILISMLSAITISRTFLLAVSPSDSDGIVRKLFSSGLN
jgi:protein-export membrane protein SecD